MERTVWSCHTCGQEEYRILTIDPKSIWHVDSLTREMLHESVGVFVSNIEDKILLFKRTVFPFAYTIPAGHLDVDETPLQAIQRELLEETTLHAKKIELITEELIEGDSCSRGADIHFWHLYKSHEDQSQEVTITQDEGVQPVWLTLKEAQSVQLTYPVRFFIEKFGDILLG